MVFYAKEIKSWGRTTIYKKKRNQKGDARSEKPRLSNVKARFSVQCADEEEKLASARKRKALGGDDKWNF
jgi:hypothetical protein